MYPPEPNIFYTKRSFFTIFTSSSTIPPHREKMSLFSIFFGAYVPPKFLAMPLLLLLLGVGKTSVRYTK